MIIKVLKFLFAYIAYLFSFSFRKNIALVSEKEDEARDNGIYFFRYAVAHCTNEKVYYVIRKGSSDYVKIRDYNKRVVFWDSFRHYYLFFCCGKMISSQAYCYPISRRLCKLFPCRKKDLYWLQHGVTKDYDPVMNYENTSRVKLCCCASPFEQSIFVESCHYPATVAQLTGFCRFDGLLDTSDGKTVLIMPTFRKWLTSKDLLNPTDREKETFLQTEYYKQYQALLSSPDFAQLLALHGLTAVFYVHYAFQGYAALFHSSCPRIIVAAKEKYDVQDLLKRSALLITDYSSVAFDFSYMRKPVIYFQFDYKEYREKHYHEGKFSYLHNGFGPVVENVEDLMTRASDCAERHFSLTEEYLQRDNEFFPQHDSLNCERVFRAVFPS